MRISYQQMQDKFQKVLMSLGFTKERAELCAKLFAEASRDGVYSHGLNRFPTFVEYIKKGFIDIHAEPEKIDEVGVMERWDGRLGPGNINADFSMNRAIELAREHGMGFVALKNTNHWMRAGSYGWQAAAANCVGICWTNTIANMPPWGAKEQRVGNNPLVLAVPREEGPVVLDIAMSQFSYGQLGNYKIRGEQLPVDGGYDSDGNLTRDPAAVLENQRPLPIGYWKGSGLSLLLDLVSVVLSGGRSSYEISKQDYEYGVSQIFIAFDMSKLPDQSSIKQSINETINDLHASTPTEENGRVRYPGEGTLKTRKENLQHGIPVEWSIWQKVLEM